MLTGFVSGSAAVVYDQSLSACKAVASQFRNTCSHGDYDTPATSVGAMESQPVQCEFDVGCIKNGTLNGRTCSWERKLCVTCFVDEDKMTKIRVQTNDLPDHCIGSTAADSMNFDYEVYFNRKETFGVWNNEFNTQQQLDNAVCPITKQYNQEELGIVEYGADVVDSERTMAFAINGVAFQFANAINEDPVAPITDTNEQPLDICLGHNQLNGNGMYHYHAVSPCISKTFLDKVDIRERTTQCVNYAECSHDVVAWSLSGFEEMKRKSVIGLSKWGQILYGPYDDSGEVWQTQDVDACNGVWSADKSEYFYAATRWHPYAGGCQGPYNFPQLGPDELYAQCSRNGMDQSAHAAEVVSNVWSANVTDSVAKDEAVSAGENRFAPLIIACGIGSVIFCLVMSWKCYTKRAHEQRNKILVGHEVEMYGTVDVGYHDLDHFE